MDPLTLTSQYLIGLKVDSATAFRPAKCITPSIASFFFDAGNGWGVDYDSSLNDSNKIRSSVGLGIDWFTLVGPLSVSF